MSQYNTEHGFSMFDLLISLVIISILAGMATPGINRWTSTYRLKSASTDFFSNMQLAKMGSVRENRPWSIDFTASGYRILDGTNQEVKNIDMNQEYSGKVIYKNPTGGGTIESDPLTFNPNGTTNSGFVYISDQDNTGYYRIGLPFTSGIIRIQRWNGSDWE